MGNKFLKKERIEHPTKITHLLNETKPEISQITQNITEDLKEDDNFKKNLETNKIINQDQKDEPKDKEHERDELDVQEKMLILNYYKGLIKNLNETKKNYE